MNEKLERLDYIEIETEIAKEEIEENKPSFHTTSETVPATLLSFALPVIKWTDRQMQMMLLMTKAPLILALFLLGNRCVKTGYIHHYRASELATRLGFERQTIYTAIHVLNALGFAKLRIKNKKVSGKLLDSPTQRVKDKTAVDIYPLQIASLHTDYLIPMLKASPTAVCLKAYLLSAFHCDEETGEINTEMRAKEWSERLNCDRTTAERAFDWLIEGGYMHAKRDYIVSGRHPGVAMGHWQLVLTRLEKEKAALEKKKSRKSGMLPFEDILLFLRKIFGIDARGWAAGHIEEAGRLLSKKIEADGLAAFRKVKEQLSQGV